MEIEISTSDADEIDPALIAQILSVDYFVLSVSVNEGERTWRHPDFR